MIRLKELEEEQIKVRSAVEGFKTAAEAEARDLSVEEAAEVDALLTRADEIDEEIAPLKARAEKTDALIAKVAPAFVRSASVQSEVPTMGEYISTYIGNARGDAGAQAKFRALATDYMVDVPGVLPTPIINSIIDRYDSTRPVFSSFTPAGAVPAKTFEQPQVTQHVAVDTQAAEGNEVASQDWRVSNYTITANTIAGAVKLSQQVVDWSSPSAMQKISEDFGKVYSRRTEVLAATALNAAATENTTWSTSSITALAQSVENAYLALEDNLESIDPSNVVLFLSPDEYAKHMALFTAEGVNFTNAIPNFPRVVRARRLPSYSILMADTSAIRAWETRKGLAQLFQLSTLEWELGTSGYVAFDIQAGAVVDCSHAGS